MRNLRCYRSSIYREYGCFRRPGPTDAMSVLTRGTWVGWFLACLIRKVMRGDTAAFQMTPARHSIHCPKSRPRSRTGLVVVGQNQEDGQR